MGDSIVMNELFIQTTIYSGKSAGPQLHTNYLDRLGSIRGNISTVLRYGKLVPFHWTTKGFRCFYCSKQMKDCVALKEHTAKHNSVDHTQFINKRIITKDVPVKIDITDLGCKICPGVNIYSLQDLVSHIVDIHSEIYDTTEVCFFPFKLNKETMQCVLCQNRYDNFSAMIGHMFKQHIDHSFVCQMCGLSFKDQVRLKRHIARSHLGHRCKLCGKIFDASYKLEKHKQRLHGQLKLYECELCSETFLTNYQMKVHMGKVHNVEKYRIKCEHCPKICMTKGAMVTHQSVHSDAKYQCDLCDYKTGIKWLVKLHQRKHFGVKEYACSICERRFGRASNLRAHMKVHTGQPGRVCRFCRKGFTGLESLTSHELEVHYYDN